MKLNARILIVDDDVNTRKLLGMTLRRAGYNPMYAGSWEEVNARVQEMNMLNKRIDAVLLDLMMPGRSGFDVLRSLHVLLHPMPPVIVLSALTGIEDAVKARELGATKYLTKPTTPDKLMKAIREVL
jgi:DNA-binding response OmpR family regulator